MISFNLGRLIKSLQWRLVSIFISIALALVIVIGISLDRMIETTYYNTFIEQINSGFDNWQLRSDASNQRIYEYLVTEKNGILLFLVNKNKTYTMIDVNSMQIVYSYYSRYLSGEEDKILASGNFISAVDTGIGNERKLLKDSEGSYFDYAKKIGSYIIYFRYDEAEWKSVTASFSRIIIISGFISMLIALLVGILLSRTITVPIVSVMKGAQKIAKGDFEDKIEVMSEDEIGKLSNAFNMMAEQLKEKLIEVSSEKSKVETILNYMTDGIVAFDYLGQLIHINPASLRSLESDRIDDDFETFSARFGLKIKLEDITYMNTLSTRIEDVTYRNKYLKLFFAPFYDVENNAEGIIVVIQDITQQMELEEMRKEFVANVSHELRTPITSIKSYSEALIDGAMSEPDVAYKFLDVICSESDRMSRLVKELLQLSRIDNKQVRWEFRDVRIDVLIRNVINKLQMEAQNKGIVIESYLLNEIPEIRCDEDRIEQVIQNILSNSIKYTDAGGKISVYIGTLSNFVYFKISDTGIGVPKEDLGRIFERFYRVDKARSRELGGTGLGLAIAKEIVEAHKGEIILKSEVDVGTEVTVKLPI
jgi:two-component system, OmpR family, sensor histidine kinase VicK